MIVSIANQKGGVGKTTTAVNLATKLSLLGNKTLLIDLDPQTNLSEYLGYEFNESDYTITNALSDVANSYYINNSPTKIVVHHSNNGVDYIPADFYLSSMENVLTNTISRETVLKRVLNTDQLKSYDYIIIDCLPSLGILTINALVASDHIIIPVQAQKFALDGARLFVNTSYKMIKNTLNPNLNLLGLLITMVDNTNMAKAIELQLRNEFKKAVFETTISKSVEATNSTYLHKSLVTQKNSKLGKQYCQFTNETIERIKNHEV